jgi:SAM-dependent methyltransferase
MAVPQSRALDPVTGQALEDTGERMLPDKAGAAPFWEHIYRYRFATRFVRGRRVLDIACGEGYGAAALARAGALSVVGIDLSAETCEHARRKYGLDARPGDAHRIPLPDRSIDVIVSFETIEHLDTPGAFLDECVRLLAPGGTLVISTPNREAFHEAAVANPFHCSEMTQAEFVCLLSPRFKNWQWYTQRLRSAGKWSTRSLAVDHSPWRESREYHRLRRRAAFLCPHLGDMEGGVEDRYRQSPVETILAKDPRFACLVNPYAIMKQSRVAREQPYYFITVARV